MGVAVAVKLWSYPLHNQLRLLRYAGVYLSDGTVQFLNIHSVIRGHHVYKEVWTLHVGEMLALQQEIGNVHDQFAVAVMMQPAATIVSHVLRELHNILYRKT